jgi:hypothetical protein
MGISQATVGCFTTPASCVRALLQAAAAGPCCFLLQKRWSYSLIRERDIYCV